MEQSNKHFIAGKYRYSLRSTGHSSSRYGNCEVCNLHVSDVHIQIEEQEYEPERWTHFECKTIFGHKECLVSKQR